MLGEFLEISLSTPDMLQSLEFYRQLGFSEASAGESLKHPYAVVTDGRLYLGLHRREAAAPVLSFVLPELVRRLPDFEALGLEFDFCEMGLDQFNRFGFPDPDGGQVALLEARTYSPVHAGHVPPSLCGYFLEYRLPVRRATDSARFWEALGLIVTPAEESGLPHAQASWAGINLGLWEAGPRARPTLVFENGDLGETLALLEMRGLPIQNDTEGLRVETPEGINLLLRPEDR